MAIIYLIIVAVLAGLALAGWLRAWRLSQNPAAKIMAKVEKGTDLAEIEREATARIADSVRQATDLFQKNLTVQALKINDELEGMAGQRLHKQIEDFNKVLDGLTITATASVGQLQALVDQRRQAIEAGMQTEVVDEKRRQLERFYGRMGDIVASYIVQSLGNEIDLSGQLPFVLKTLEVNKDIIKEDLLSDY